MPSGYGKNRAMGYSDFYKNTSATPDTNDEEDITKMSPEDKKKAAIRRRLMKMRKKAGN